MNGHHVEYRGRRLQNIREVLVFDTGGIGDTLVSLPAMRALKKAYPSARVGRVITPRCGDLLDNEHSIDHVMVYDNQGREKGIVGKLRFLKNVRSGQYDLFLNLQTPRPCRGFMYYFRDNLFSFLTGSRYRIAFYEKGSGFMLTHALPAQRCDPAPVTQLVLQIAAAAGADTGGGIEEGLCPDSGAAEYIAGLLEEHGVVPGDVLIGIHTGTRHSYARWHEERFELLIERLTARYHARILLTGNHDDQVFIQTIRSRLTVPENTVIDLSGKTTVSQLVAAVSLCQLFISVDSGPMHIAAVLDIPLIALMSGRDFPRKWAPQNSRSSVIRKTVACSPCFLDECSRNRCMEMITVDEVLDLAEKMLDTRCAVLDACKR